MELPAEFHPDSSVLYKQSGLALSSYATHIDVNNTCFLVSPCPTICRDIVQINIEIFIEIYGF